MNKKCIFCEDKAQYAIKNTKDYYCTDCASEQFGDLSYLISIDKTLKQQKENSETSEEIEEHIEEITKEE